MAWSTSVICLSVWLLGVAVEASAGVLGISVPSPQYFLTCNFLAPE